MGRFDAESVGRGNLSRGGNAATSLILTASLRRDDSDIHILTFLAFHWIWPSSPPFPYLYIRIQLVYWSLRTWLSAFQSVSVGFSRLSSRLTDSRILFWFSDGVVTRPFPNFSDSFEHDCFNEPMITPHHSIIVKEDKEQPMPVDSSPIAINWGDRSNETLWWPTTIKTLDMGRGQRWK